MREAGEGILPRENPDTMSRETQAPSAHEGEWEDDGEERDSF